MTSRPQSSTSATTAATGIPSLSDALQITNNHAVISVTQASPSTSPDCSSDDSSVDHRLRLRRPKLGSRKSSGSMIIPRDSPRCEMRPGEEEYDEHDVRSMSPRRSSEDIERLGAEARNTLMEQAKMLQTSLMAIVDRVEAVRTEHEKLEGGNKFLQSYIGELIQTSKITSTAPTKSRGRQIR